MSRAPGMRFSAYSSGRRTSMSGAPASNAWAKASRSTSGGFSFTYRSLPTPELCASVAAMRRQMRTERRLGSSEEALGDGFGHRGLAAVHTELRVDVAEVGLHRGCGDE